ncbi:MAG TPA: TetR/AcrR family transcriptional regulator [Mycobacteriales bacterium]|jgi:AcrR family transcriptional regulator
MATVPPRRRGSSDTARRPGGRTARASQAILDATLAELVEVGYGSLALDRIAARAGVHRSTVYRRWANKEELVVDAVLASAARDVPTPDTGSVRGDLRALTHAIVGTLSAPISLTLLRTYVAESGRAPGIDAVATSFWAQRFALAGSIIERGIERGELDPHTDADLLIETLVAPLFLRILVTGKSVTTKYADRIVELTLAAHSA